jgi:hypothetical protein
MLLPFAHFCPDAASGVKTPVAVTDTVGKYTHSLVWASFPLWLSGRGEGWGWACLRVSSSPRLQAVQRYSEHPSGMPGPIIAAQQILTE